MKVELQDAKLTRRAAYAGTAYPADPVELSETIDKLIDQSRRPQSTKGNLRALISPSTGGIYSDLPCFAGLRTLRARNFKTVVMLTTSQQNFFDFASVYNGGAYNTPLGRVFVDLELARKLSELHPKVIMSDTGHEGGPRQEYGIELLLPAMQRLLGGFAIVPIVLGSDDDATSIAVGEVLSSIAGDESTLIVGAVNLLEAEELNSDLRKRLVGSILTRDLNRTSERIRAGQVSGAAPLLAIMYATSRIGITDIILPKSDGTEWDDQLSDLSILSVAFLK